MTNLTGTYRTTGYGVSASADPLDAAIAELCGDLSPAEVRVIEDAKMDPDGEAWLLATVAGIVADHRDVDVEDVEDEVREAFDSVWY